jgi:uncharacterized membrane protein
MDIKRVIKHLSIGQAVVSRQFPAAVLDTIEHAIKLGESQYSGQICYVVEASLALKPLMAGQRARDRAIEVFSTLRVWDTECNNGVLIYLLLADRKVEILADRGIHARLGQTVWEDICREMEFSFRAGKFEQGVLAGIAHVSQHLAELYPKNNSNQTNELPDRPVII